MIQYGQLTISLYDPATAFRVSLLFSQSEHQIIYERTSNEIPTWINTLVYYFLIIDKGREKDEGIGRGMTVVRYILRASTNKIMKENQRYSSPTPETEEPTPCRF